jgi:hypothetical protein
LFWPFDMTGGELPGWRVVRADRAFEGGGEAHVHLLLAPVHGDADHRLRVETWQLPSRERAHEYLAGLLARLEGGPPPRLDPPPAGDVAFAGSNRYALAFARGNLVVRLRNAGLDLIPVEAAAAALDAWLIRRPEAAPGPDPAAGLLPEAEAVSPAPFGTKYFADRGNLSALTGTVVLQGAPAGTRVERIALDHSIGQAAETVELRAG